MGLRVEYQPFEFIAVDGEGNTSSDRKSSLVLLAASNGEHIQSDTLLRTADCLEFLLSLKTKKRQVVCGFSFQYDVNNILRQWIEHNPDTSRSLLKHLSLDDYIWVRDGEFLYRVRIIPKKCMEIRKFHKEGRQKRKFIKFVQVYDVFGFFQCSFLKALEDWKIGTETELEFIRTYKDKRGECLFDEWKRWVEYNNLECDLLVRMMNRFQETLLARDIKLSHWWGAACIAKYWVKQNNVKLHLVQKHTEEIDGWILDAYYGGRMHANLRGYIDARVYHYDICSAYPWATSKLPTLVSKWRATDRFEPGKTAIYDIEWECSTGSLLEGWEKFAAISPFPLRTRSGAIRYPACGRGRYWAPEVEMALSCFPQCVRIIGGIVSEASESVLPFRWVEPLFQQRNELKRRGDLRNIPLKLGLNSLYGMMAQALTTDSKGLRKIPTYQCYAWAGMVTSMTRARLLEAMMLDPHNIICCATDSIFSLQPLPLQTGKELRRARGAEDRNLDFDGMRRVFPYAGSICHRQHRFIGYKQSAMGEKIEDFCTWTDIEKTIQTVDRVAIAKPEHLQHPIHRPPSVCRYVPIFNRSFPLDQPFSKRYQPKGRDIDSVERALREAYWEDIIAAEQPD